MAQGPLLFQDVALAVAKGFEEITNFSLLGLIFCDGFCVMSGSSQTESSLAVKAFLPGLHHCSTHQFNLYAL